MAQQQALAGARQPPGSVATAKGETTEIELSPAQQAIARRAAESKATVPHLVLEAQIDMHESAMLRALLAAGPPKTGEAAPPAGEAAPPAGDAAPPAGDAAPPAGDAAPPAGDAAPPAGEAAPRTGAASPWPENPAAPAVPGGPAQREPIPTYEDMVVKACALALREYPRANSSYRDGRLQVYGRVNVGLVLWADPGSPDDAMSDGTPVTPTLFDADLKPLERIARETRLLAERARTDAIAPPELSGATFTVTSLGAFPITSFTAIINPPQAATLAVGAVELRPVAHAGAIVARHTMTATLACDGRALGGAEAAGLLGRIRQLLQEPAALAH